MIKRMFTHNNDPANGGKYVKVDWSKGTIITVSDPNWTWEVKEFKDPFQNQKTQNKTKSVRNDEASDFSFESTDS